jgi:hypothetical protein
LDKKTLQIIHKIILITLILIGLAGIIIPIYLKQYGLLILSSYLAIPILAGCLIYLLKKNSLVVNTKLKKNIRFYQITYSIILIISIFILFLFNTRNIFYYITISLLATVILVEIMTINLSINYRSILFQITLSTMSVIYSTNLKYDYFIGRTDILFHVNIINNLKQSGFITSIFDVYQPFPLWHILNVINLEITNIAIPVQKSIFLLSGIIFGVAILVIFVLTRYITKSIKFSLLVSLLIGIFPDFIFLGMYAIPRSTTVIFELLILLFLLKKATTKSFYLAIFLTFITLIYHTTVIFFIMTLLVIIAVIIQFLPVKEITMNWKYFIISFVIIIIYWYNYSKVLMLQLSTSLYTQIINPSTNISLGREVTFPLNEVFNYIQYGIIIFLIVIGTLHVTNSRHKNIIKTLIILGFLSILVSFPGPISLFRTFAYSLQIIRFAEVTYIFTNLAAAMGLLYIYSRASNNYKRLIILAFFLFAFLSVSNEFVATDNPFVKRIFYTDYFTNAETISMTNVASFSQRFIYSDQTGLRYLQYTGFPTSAQIIEVNPNTNVFLRGSNIDVFLIRTGELTERPLRIFTNTGSFIYNPSLFGDLEYYSADSPIWQDLLQLKMVYNSGKITAYN